ncbi:MAG: class I SAM-dependent rRNA methyltransferase [Gammaproteobacteria bacterium]
MQLKELRLKKNEDRRLRAGHVWIYSNEIDTKISPLKSFTSGEEVRVVASDQTPLGIAYVNPHSLITGRLFSRVLNTRLNVAFFSERIKTALALRTRLYSRPFYRLIFGDSDGLPGLVVDRFNQVLVVQITTIGMETQKDAIIAGLREVFPDVESILFRNDSRSRLHEGLETYVSAAFGTPPETITLEENGLTFSAPLWTGQKTGWFFDHRLNRSRLTHYANNQRVLDVFSYLGAWGIQAAKSGATDVTCVDSSALASDWIMENARLNQVAEKVKVICDDAFVALKNLSAAKEKFGVIILDPPAFVKKLKDKKEGLIAYQRLNEAAMKLLEPDGILISCSCSMHVDYSELVNSIRRAGLQVNCEIQILERGHQAPDHPVHIAIPETDYLKMVIVRCVKSA